MIDAEEIAAHDGRALTPKRRGRKLDTARNAQILDATLEVLAEVGYDATTVDMVAARSHAARATVYRRWATKADLVVEAVRHMSCGDAEPGPLPDTGTLRDDLIATIAPQTIEQQKLRISVMSGLISLARTDPRLAEAAAGAGLEPWLDVSRALLQRAVDRGEYPAADVATIAQVIPMMCVCRISVQQQPITREFSMSLIDNVILPAMRGPSTAAPDTALQRDSTIPQPAREAPRGRFPKAKQ